MPSLPDILYTVVSRSVALVIGVSLRFTSSRPKHSNSETNILVTQIGLWILLASLINAHSSHKIHGICMGYKLSFGLYVECHNYLIFYGLLFLGIFLQ